MPSSTYPGVERISREEVGKERSQKEQQENEMTPEQKLKMEEAILLKHTKANERGTSLKGIAYFTLPGAALSRDLSITPAFLSAIPSGLFAAIDLSIVFTVASILSLLTLVQLGTKGLAKTFEHIPQKSTTIR
jgi:hypothetical protein